VDISDTSMAASGTTKKITTNQILGSGGTATLASATISGDLTVDTSTLKVDSTNNRVGIGTASPAHLLDILATGASTATSSFAVARITGASAVANDLTLIGPNTSQVRINFGDVDSSSVGEVGYDHSTNRMRFVVGGNEQYRIDPSGVFTWLDGAGGTRMTLNSTGLGIGASPANYGATFRTLAVNATDAGLLDLMSNSVSQFRIFGNGIENRLGGITNVPMTFHTNNTEKMQISASGQVGIGVTPSATDSTYYQALEITRVGQGLTGAKNALTSSPNSWLSNNSYATYSAGIVWKYAVSQPAAQYRLLDASHQWYRSTDVTPTAGNAITFTQAMTLNAAGSLVLGAAAVATTATDGFLYIPGCAGTPTGTPTAQTGRVPLVVDTTNNKLYFYSGGSWVAAN